MANSSFSAIQGAPGGKPAGQIWLSAAGMWPSTTAGCKVNALSEQATGKQNVYTLDFIDASTTSCEGNLMMPSDYNGGTVTAVFVWMANDATAHVVDWGCQGYSYADGTTLDQTWGTQITVTDANNSVANQVRISAATSAITLGGTPGASQLALFRIQRIGGDASDTLTVDARLLGVMVGFTRT